jgi:hypothetical protein
MTAAAPDCLASLAMTAALFGLLRRNDIFLQKIDYRQYD